MKFSYGTHILSNGKLFSKNDNNLFDILSKKIKLTIFDITSYALDKFILKKQYKKITTTLSYYNIPEDQHNIDININEFSEAVKYLIHSTLQFKENDRNRVNLVGSSGVIVDIDEAGSILNFIEKMKESNLKYILYTSKSNIIKDGSERFHIFFPFNNFLETTDYEKYVLFLQKFFKYIHQKVGFKPDPRCADSARLIYSSFYNENKNFKCIINDDGDYLNYHEHECNEIVIEKKKKRKQKEKKITVEKKPKTKSQKKYSLLKNPIKTFNNSVEVMKFSKEYVNSFCFDERFLINRENVFGETTANKYIHILIKSLVNSLRKNRYLKQSSRVLKIEYLQILITQFNSGYTKKHKQTKQFIDDYLKSSFVESYNDSTFIISSNKSLNNAGYASNEIISLQIIKNILKSKNKKGFSLNDFVKMSVLLQMSKPTFVKNDDKNVEKETTFGYRTMGRVAKMFDLTQERVSQICKPFNKAYFNNLLFVSDTEKQAKKFMFEYICEQNEILTITKCIIDSKEKYIVFCCIGSKVVLEEKKLKLENYRIFKHKFSGKTKLSFLANTSKYIMQDIIIDNEENVCFYNGGEEVKVIKNIKTRHIKNNKLQTNKMMVYIAKKRNDFKNIKLSTIEKLEKVKKSEFIKNAGVINDNPKSNVKYLTTLVENAQHKVNLHKKIYSRFQLFHTMKKIDKTCKLKFFNITTEMINKYNELKLIKEKVNWIRCQKLGA